MPIDDKYSEYNYDMKYSFGAMISFNVIMVCHYIQHWWRFNSFSQLSMLDLCPMSSDHGFEDINL